MFFLKKITSIIYILANINFTLNYPPKKKILLFDDNLEEFLKKYFKNKYVVLHTRQKKYNLLIFLRILIKNYFIFDSEKYFHEFINYVNPIITITFTDNLPVFWKIRKNEKNTKIFVQGANRTNTLEDVFCLSKNFKKNRKNHVVDHMLVFNKKVGQIYETFIKGNHKVIGSFRSNSHKKTKNKKFDLFFISTWREHSPDYPITTTINFGKFLITHVELLKYVYAYAKKNKRHLTVYGKYDNKKEKKYFLDILGEENKYWSFLKNDRDKTYRYLDQSSVVVSTTSTLGIECLGRESNLAIFNICKFDKSTISKAFGWPYKLKAEGPFWTSKLSQDSCDKLLNKVSSYKKEQWKKIKKNYDSKIISFDLNNKKFVNLVNNLLSRKV